MFVSFHNLSKTDQKPKTSQTLAEENQRKPTKKERKPVYKNKQKQNQEIFQFSEEFLMFFLSLGEL